MLTYINSLSNFSTYIRNLEHQALSYQNSLVQYSNEIQTSLITLSEGKLHPNLVPLHALRHIMDTLNEGSSKPVLSQDELPFSILWTWWIQW